MIADRPRTGPAGPTPVRPVIRRETTGRTTGSKRL